MRVCYVLKGTGMKEGGLILHPEELRVLEVQGKDGNICTLWSVGPWRCFEFMLDGFFWEIAHS